MRFFYEKYFPLKQIDHKLKWDIKVLKLLIKYSFPFYKKCTKNTKRNDSILNYIYDAYYGISDVPKLRIYDNFLTAYNLIYISQLLNKK